MVDQRLFFDNSKNQYPPKKIINPLVHTEIEINLIIQKLKDQSCIKKIIDFGCGTGRLTIPLVKQDYRVIAIDISKRSILRLKNLVVKIGKDKLLDFSYSIKRFRNIDIIVGADVLHHVDINEYFKKFYKILKKRGKIVFSEPNCLNISWIIYNSLLMNWKIEKGLFQCSYFNLSNKLIKNGFKTIKINGFGLFPPPLLNRFPLLAKINYFLGDLPIFKLFAYRFIIEADKA